MIRRKIALLPLAVLLIPAQAARASGVEIAPESPLSVVVYDDETLHNVTINLSADQAINWSVSWQSPFIANVSPSSGELAGGATQPINVTLNVSEMAAEGVREADIALDFTTNVTNITYVISVTRKALRGELSFSPSPLSAAVPKGQAKDVNLQITNGHDVKIALASWSGPSWISRVFPLADISPGGSWTVVVTFSARSLPEGNFSDYLCLNYTAEGREGEFRACVPIQMRVTSPPPPPVRTCHLKVIAMSLQTYGPIEGAIVTVQGEKSYAGVTRADGTAEFDVPNGTYTVMIVARNHSGYTANLNIQEDQTHIAWLQPGAPPEEPQPPEEPEEEAPQNISQAERGLIGLPYTQLNVTVPPGGQVTKYVVLTAEGGPVGPVRIVPDSSTPNWIRARLNESSDTFEDGAEFILAISVAPPSEVSGNFSRTFQILGGRDPAQLTVSVSVTKQRKASQNETEDLAVSGLEIPRVIVKLENGTALAPGQTYTVLPGTLVHVVISGDPSRILVNASGDVALFENSGSRLTYQVNGPGELTTFFMTFDEVGSRVLHQPPELGYGRFAFRIEQVAKNPAIEVLVSVDPPVTTVGEPVTIEAYAVFHSSLGLPATSPYQGALVITTPSGRADPLPLGLDGKAQYTPVEPGEYLISVPDVSLAEESARSFRAEAQTLSEMVYEALTIGESTRWDWPTPFADIPSCDVSPPAALAGLTCDSEGVTFIPAEEGAIFTIYATGRLAEGYQGLPAGATVTFALTPATPVRGSITHAVGSAASGAASWLGTYWPLLVVGAVGFLGFLRWRSGMSSLKGRRFAGR